MNSQTASSTNPISKRRTDSSLLRKIDIFGYSPELNYFGHTTSTSTFGGLATIMVGLCYASIFAFTIWRYFERSSPETNVDRLFVKDPEGFVLNKDTLPFAFGIQDPNTAEHFIDESIYTVVAKHIKSYNDVVNGELIKKSEETILDLVPCSEVNMDLNYLNNLELSKMYCLKEFVENKKELRITGMWESDQYGRLEFWFERCKTNCKTNEEIDKKLKDSYFAVNYVNWNAKASDFKNPKHRYPTSYYASTSAEYTKYITQYMTDNEIVTDSSLVGYMEADSLKYTSTGYFQIDTANFVFEPNKYPESFVRYNIRMDPNKLLISRKYKNIYDYLAEFGGMAQVVVLVGVILTFRLKKINMFLDLADKIIDKEEFYQRLVKEKTIVPLQSPPFHQNVTTTTGTPSPLTFPTKNPKQIIKPPGISLKITEEVDISESLPSVGDEGKDRQRVRDNVRGERNKSTGRNTEVEINKQDDHQKEQHSEYSRARVMQPQQYSKETLALLRDSKKLFKYERMRFETIKTQVGKINAFKVLLKGFFPCCATKSRINSVVEMVESQVYSKYDLMRIIETIDEFDKLKHFLLTPDQLMLFDLIPTSKLKYSQESKSFSLANDHRRGKFSKEEGFLSHKQKLEAAFTAIKSKQTKSEFDRNLIRSLGFLFEGDDSQYSNL